MADLRLGFSTLPCMELDAGEIAQYCVKYGISAIELRADDDGTLCGCGKPEQLERLREVFSQKGIVITNIGSGVCLKGYDTAQVAAARVFVDKAQLLRARGVRVFLGNFARRFDAPVEPLCHEGIVKALRELSAYAGERDVEIWVETHNEYATGRALAPLLAEVGRPGLKIIWDIMHPLEDGEGIEETWSRIGAHIAHVHIKDGKKRADPAWHDYEYTALGDGDLPLERIVALLRREGFGGCLSLEWENVWRPELSRFGTDMDDILSMFRGAIDRAQSNLLDGFDKQTWFTWTPSGAQTPQWGRGADFAEISAGENSYQYGKWCHTAGGVAGGETYRFEAYYTASGMPSENLSVSAVLTWMKRDGEGEQRWIMRSYADTLEDLGDRKKLSLRMRAPEGAYEVRVELALKWHGRVRWSKPGLWHDIPLEKRMVRVAAAYVKPAATEGENLEKALRAIDSAATRGPDLICLAETLFDRGTGLPLSDTADTVPGKYTKLLGERARRYHAYICFSLHEWDGRHFYTTAVLLDRSGAVAGKYRKTHLALYEGERGIVPGSEFPVFQTDFGALGMLVCWDHYFPEPPRRMRLGGAELLVVSTAGDAPHQSVSRAVENGLHVVVAGVNREEGSPLGPSRIIGPTGRVLAQTEEDMGFAAADIDLNEREYSFWLSVGPALGEGRVIYPKERRTDLWENTLERNHTCI